MPTTTAIRIAYLRRPTPPAAPRYGRWASVMRPGVFMRCSVSIDGQPAYVFSTKRFNLGPARLYRAGCRSLPPCRSFFRLRCIKNPAGHTRESMRNALPREQKRAVLFVMFVVMIAMVWFAMSALRISRQNLQFVGYQPGARRRLRSRRRCMRSNRPSAADQFTKDPSGVAAVPIPTDIDGDGTIDFTAHLVPQPDSACACDR